MKNKNNKNNKEKPDTNNNDGYYIKPKKKYKRDKFDWKRFCR